MKQARRPDHLYIGEKTVKVFVEHLELYDVIAKRKKNAGKRISLDKLLKKEGITI